MSNSSPPNKVIDETSQECAHFVKSSNVDTMNPKDPPISDSNVLLSDEQLREVVFRKGTGISMMVSGQVNGNPVSILVDTGAQACVISQEFYESMGQKPTVSEKVRLSNVNKENSKLVAYFIPDVTFTFGDKDYHWSAYVAPISDNFLLGMDFLDKFGSAIDLEHYQLKLRGIDGCSNTIKGQRVSNGHDPSVCRVTLGKRGSGSTSIKSDGESPSM